MNPILVTGATGFLGAHLCRSLRADGIPVRALVRGDSAVAPADYAVCPVRDLSDRRGLRSALSGVETVIHLAARVHVMDARGADALAEFRRVNVDGTRILMEEAVMAGARRLVFASSVKAVGEQNEYPWTERMRPHPVDPYGISKFEAEELVRKMGREAGVQAVIVRFPLIYGPGMKGNMLSLFEWVDRGVPLPLGSVSNRRSLLYVGNAVAALESILDSSVGSETFFVSDGADLSTPDLVREIARALSRPAHLFRFPTVGFHVAAFFGDAVNQIIPCPLNSARIDRLLGSLTVDPSKLHGLTGFRPPYSVQRGLLRTADWYRNGQLELR